MNTITHLSFLCAAEAHVKEGQPGTLNVQVVLDGTPKSDHIVNVADALFGGARQLAEITLFTCSCGHAGCAGFFDPIRHSRSNGQVVWEVNDELTSKVLGGNRFVFEASAFDAALAELRTAIEAAEPNNVFAASMMDIDWSGDEEGGSLKGTSLAEIEDRAVRYHASFERLASIAAQALDANAPTTLLLSFSGSNPHTSAITDAAFCLLNFGPSPEPLPEDRVAALPNAITLLQRFAADKDTAAAEAATAPFKRFAENDELGNGTPWAFRITDEGHALLALS